MIAILVTYFYLYAFKPTNGGQGVKAALIDGFKILRSDHTARRLFFLSLYTALVLFRTLLNRDLWLNPLSNPFGGWGIYETDPNNGEVHLSSEVFENLFMLMPMIGLSIWTFPKWYQRKGYFKGSFIIAGGMSLIIESSQLLFRLGTFQFSDLTYNTLGGVIAGAITKAVTYGYRRVNP